MRIGLTYTLKSPALTPAPHDDWPDDAEEEFDGPETVQALADTIRSLGHDVALLGDGEAMVRRLLTAPRPDLVVNMSEGRGNTRCREAWVPAVLEMLGIPYTGADPLTLAATLDKDCAKRLVRDAGVATPRWVVVDPAVGALRADLADLTFPVLAKPACEGSSKGIHAVSVIHTPAELTPTLGRLIEVYDQAVLVEEYIAGDELTVGVVGAARPEVLGIMRVVPTRGDPTDFIYDLETKRNWRATVRYECPAPLEAAVAAAVREAAMASWHALGCRDVARIDFRLRDGVPYFLEANPLPGLSPDHGDVVILAGLVGIEYRELIARILAAAGERLAAARPPAAPAPTAGEPPRRATSDGVRLRGMREADIPRLVEITRDCGVFRPDEVAVAEEVLTAADAGEDYEATVAEVHDRLVGWAVHGLTPLTDATYDLYWIAVDPACQGRGIGTALLKHVERRVADCGGRWVTVETSSLPPYARARALYERGGYEQVGWIPDFYAPGDARVMYARRADGTDGVG